MSRIVHGGGATPVHITGSDVSLSGGGGGSGDASLAEQQTQTTKLTAIQAATEATQAAVEGVLSVDDGGGSLTVDGTVELSATEVVVGATVGKSVVVTPTLTVSTSPAYTAGDIVAGKITLTSAVRVSGGISYLMNIMITDRANQKPAGYVVIFNADPTAATLTDNAAANFSTDDFKVVAAVTVADTDYVVINSKAYASVDVNGKMCKAASGTTLYAAFVLSSTPTFAATSDLQMQFAFVQD